MVKPQKQLFIFAATFFVDSGIVRYSNFIVYIYTGTQEQCVCKKKKKEWNPPSNYPICNLACGFHIFIRKINNFLS